MVLEEQFMDDTTDMAIRIDEVVSDRQRTCNKHVLMMQCDLLLAWVLLPQKPPAAEALHLKHMFWLLARGLGRSTTAYGCSQ